MGKSVVCGNRLKALDGSSTAQQSKEEPHNLYAGGADGTTIRGLLRKSLGNELGNRNMRRQDCIPPGTS